MGFDTLDDVIIAAREIANRAIALSEQEEAAFDGEGEVPASQDWEDLDDEALQLVYELAEMELIDPDPTQEAESVDPERRVR